MKNGVLKIDCVERWRSPCENWALKVFQMKGVLISETPAEVWDIQFRRFFLSIVLNKKKGTRKSGFVVELFISFDKFNVVFYILFFIYTF